MLPDSVEFLCKLCGAKEDREKLLEALKDYVRDSYVKVSSYGQGWGQIHECLYISCTCI